MKDYQHIESLEASRPSHTLHIYSDNPSEMRDSPSRCVHNCDDDEDVPSKTVRHLQINCVHNSKLVVVVNDIQHVNTLKRIGDGQPTCSPSDDAGACVVVHS